MAYDKFLIGFNDDNSSLQTDVRPWLIANNAFAQLNNAYVFRGRVRKRFGSRFMGTGWAGAQDQPLYSRLRINIGTTDGSGNLIFTNLPGTILNPGAAFSVGSIIFTVTTVPTVGNNAATLSTDPGPGGPAVGTVRFDSTAPNVYQFRITGSQASIAGAIVYFYPALPVMGITQYETGAISDHPTYAFDTEFAYKFAGGAWNRSGTKVWHGTNLNFFWSTNWDGITPNITTLFTTNFYAVNINGASDPTDDPIRYTSDGSNWHDITDNEFPSSVHANRKPFTIFNSAGAFIKTSRIVLPFKNRLILLNTIECTAGSDGRGTGGTNTNYVNRCRYSINGSPFAQNASGNDSAPYSWLETNQTYTQGAATANAQGAGFIDATTEEAIISAEFIKDRLIVYFERSTWELVYTFNDELPFVWQKINTELGSESQQSTVPFDKVVLTVGATGIHACSGATVERVDQKIPDKVFQVLDKSIGVQRVAGIRDYYVEMVYWSFPADNQASGQVYPGRVLVYNYKTGAWALNDDCITAFGYFEQQDGMTWANQIIQWQEADFSWQSGTVEAQFRQVIAGNQQGYTFIIDSDIARNANAMQITNITISNGIVTLVIIDHTLQVGDYISVENPGGITFSTDQRIFQVVQANNSNFNVVINATNMSGTYTGGGTSARVSQLSILSKQWNPYNSSKNPSENLYLAKIDFYVDKTANGQVSVDYFDSSTQIEQINNSIPGVVMGNAVLETTPYDPSLYPMEQFQDRLWHSMYFQASGNCVQIEIFYSTAQITTSNIAWSDFELHGLVLNTERAGRLQ